MSKTERKSGRVTHFNSSRGFGFVELAGQDRELFLHISDWAEDEEPRQGDRVTFMESTGRDGRPRAISVTLSRI